MRGGSMIVSALVGLMISSMLAMGIMSSFTAIVREVSTTTVNLDDRTEKDLRGAKDSIILRNNHRRAVQVELEKY